MRHQPASTTRGRVSRPEWASARGRGAPAGRRDQHVDAAGKLGLCALLRPHPLHQSLRLGPQCALAGDDGDCKPQRLAKGAQDEAHLKGDW